MWDLPGQSGEILIRRLRAQARTRELPIVIVSSRAGEHGNRAHALARCQELRLLEG